MRAVLLFAAAFTAAFAADEGPAGPPEGAILIGEGYQFAEGPAIAPDGSLYFTDTRAGKVYRWDGKGAPKAIAENTAGGNGLAFDIDGNLYTCQGAGRTVSKVNPDGSLTKFCDAADGAPLNQPNDLVFDSHGNLFFTNPGSHSKPCVVRVKPDGTANIVASDQQYPNGIRISPDSKWLYVCDTAGGSKLWRYPLADGNLGKGEVFVDFGRGGPDGMTVAASGNVYVALNLGAKVAVVSPEGKVLKEYPFPRGAGVSNVCFGGPDLRTLYITLGNHGKVYSLPADEPGFKMPVRN